MPKKIKVEKSLQSMIDEMANLKAGPTLSHDVYSLYDNMMDKVDKDLRKAKKIHKSNDETPQTPKPKTKPRKLSKWNEYIQIKKVIPSKGSDEYDDFMKEYDKI